MTDAELIAAAALIHSAAKSNTDSLEAIKALVEFEIFWRSKARIGVGDSMCSHERFRNFENRLYCSACARDISTHTAYGDVRLHGAVSAELPS